MAEAELYTELRSQIADHQHEAVVQTAGEILEADADNLSIIQAKAIALINLNKFEQVVKFFGSNQHADSFAFEQGYALYRLQKFDKALEVIEGAEGPPVALLKLKAQVQYRLGRYDECIETYNSLVDDHGLNTSELQTNLTAAYASSGQGRRGLEDLFGGSGEEADVPDDMFELVYNAACASIDCGDLKTAKQQLEHAREVCQTMLEGEDFTEQEIQSEMAIIICQLAYLHQLQQQDEEAMSLYQEVLKSGTSDKTVTAAASNNIMSLHKNHDYFDSYKKSKATTSEGLESKLTTRQRQIFAFNRALLLLYMNKKGKELDTQVSSLEKLSSNDDDMPVLVAATKAYQEKNFDQAQSILRTWISKTQGDTVRAQLSLAQIQFLQKDTAACIKTLQGLDSLQHRPAMVATLVDLYTTQGNVKGACKVFDAAQEYWKNAMDVDGLNAKTTRLAIVKESAKYRLQHGDYEPAIHLYEEILEEDENDVEALAGLVQVAAHVDPDLAEEYARRLPSAMEGQGMTDKEKDELENASTHVTSRRRADPTQSSANAAAAEGSGSGGAPSQVADGKRKADVGPDGEQRPAKKKKKRKPRYPKGFDPNNPDNKPYDPSHWIPKRDRYRRRRRGPVSRGGHQGAQETEKERAKRIKAEQDAALKAEKEAEKQAAAAEANQQKQQKKSRRQKKKK